MRLNFVCVALTLAVISNVGFAREYPLEQKVASVDAGRMIDVSDTSVQRTKYLLENVSSKYGITQEKAADLASFAMNELKKENQRVGTIEFLEGALIACADSRDWKNDLSKFTSVYLKTRIDFKVTHEVAVRSFIALQTTLINASGKK